jgi:hypothetical protein
VFDLEELLVPGGDLFGAQVRVGAAQQVLSVQIRLGFDLLGVDAEFPAGVTRRNRFRPGPPASTCSPEPR